MVGEQKSFLFTQVGELVMWGLGKEFLILAEESQVIVKNGHQD